MAPFFVPPTRSKREVAVREGMKISKKLFDKTGTKFQIYNVVPQGNMPCEFVISQNLILCFTNHLFGLFLFIFFAAASPIPTKEQCKSIFGIDFNTLNDGLLKHCYGDLENKPQYVWSNGITQLLAPKHVMRVRAKVQTRGCKEFETVWI